MTTTGKIYVWACGTTSWPDGKSTKNGHWLWAILIPGCEVNCNRDNYQTKGHAERSARATARRLGITVRWKSKKVCAHCGAPDSWDVRHSPTYPNEGTKAEMQKYHPESERVG